MGKMTLDQVAQRVTKAKNNRVAKDLPLLAATGTIPPELLTDEDRERERIERQRAGFAVWWKEFEKRQDEDRRLAERCQAECHELVSEERYEELVNGMKHIAHCGPEYHLDYWRRQLARLDPKYCPHFKDGHAVVKAMGHDQCPVCLVEGFVNGK